MRAGCPRVAVAASMREYCLNYISQLAACKTLAATFIRSAARLLADEIAGKRIRKGLVDADSLDDAVAMSVYWLFWSVRCRTGRNYYIIYLL